MTSPRAADLPVGSIVVDDDRFVVWIAAPRAGQYMLRWTVSGSERFISDSEVDAMMRYNAKVLRVGGGSDR